MIRLNNDVDKIWRIYWEMKLALLVDSISDNIF